VTPHLGLNKCGDRFGKHGFPRAGG
jgi:hypothetical protein